MPAAAEITKVVVHMYKMGTGDCFVLKFHDGNKILFKILIDCGCWSGSKAELIPYIEKLKDDVKGHVNVLIVTHEHKDHVYGFEAGSEIFLEHIAVDQIWMGWTEEDSDPEVKRWKEKYAERTMAIAKAAQEVRNRLDSPGYVSQYKDSQFKDEIFQLHTHFKDVLGEFADLHASDTVKPGLKGMTVVKEDIAKNNIQYFKPGTIMKDIEGLPGVKIFVLGPPLLYDTVRTESGGPGESYDHNKDIDADELLLGALNFHENGNMDEKIFPFDSTYEVSDKDRLKIVETAYKSEEWRGIDFDWLMSSGSLALRMNSLTNNLSLALAFQFPEERKVMLFPGDAEFGSWSSWHDIEWEDEDETIDTKDLLNQTVFYKVAHHLSHNGTAQSLGLKLMTHKDLAAMATLDYSIISSGWKSTMPNRLIIKDLLAQTKGRLMIMNTDNLFYDLDDQIPLAKKIEDSRKKMKAADHKKFLDSLDNSDEHFMEYVVKIK